MAFLVPFIRHIAAPLMPAVDALSSALSATAHCSPGNGDCTAAAFTISTALIGAFCILSTCWMHARLCNIKDRAKLDGDAADVACSFREALLTGAAQGVVVLRNAEQERQHFGEGLALYEACMGSPQAGTVIQAIDLLVEEGQSFALSIRGDIGALTLRGMPVAGRAVLYLQHDAGAANQERYQEILEALPIPVWMRGIGNAVRYANKAFLSTVGFASLEDAVTANAALDWSEHDLSTRALEDQRPVAGRASAIVDGKARAFSLGLVPMSDTAVAGYATDITEYVRLDSKLQLAYDAQEDMVERIPFAVAVFDGEQKLASYNGAYADLWGFSRSWLDCEPSYGEILDRLRDKRRLPEQRNFAEWKQAQVQLVAQAGDRREELWHLPNGKSIRIVTQPHLQGGAFAMFEDITERLRLESALNLLTQVQQATLDTLDEGVAIFGTNGRLFLHNALFTSMWQLSESELEGQPHFAEIANLCTDKIGRDGIWGIVSCGINSTTPERFGECGKAKRADGRTISLALSRLPNGATVVTFTDITDLEQFSALQNTTSHAAA
ncbi:MAG TPA: PAS-domain containing protein [Rhizomicrobium sp.]|nr:PAS-domain containing protein [Rhizomicrobium sp.]